MPPDVVELTNGGTVRGTIVENIPGDHVTIQLVTGEIRTFAAAEVARVGPAAPTVITVPPVIATPPPPVDVAPQPRMARLTVETDAEDFLLHRVTGTASMRGMMRSIDAFDVVCPLPCAVDLEPGTYYLGLSRGRRDPTRWRTPFVVEGNTTLSLDFESRGDQRLIGGLVLAGGILAGAGIIVGSTVHLLSTLYRDNAAAFAGMIAGGVVIIVAVIVGTYFAAMRDHVDLRTGSLRF